jgi:hypothetical protein
MARDSSAVSELQQNLLRDDQTIRNVPNSDPLDLARTAEVLASSALAEADPAHVINGFVRDLPGKWDNRWAAEMREGGVYLELRWTDPIQIGQVQITFDTGFHRELTLTHQDSLNKKMIRAAQPETVRDYELLYQSPASHDWTSLGSFTGNHQRLRRHRFTPVRAGGLRILVTATNGSKEARIYEVRCYPV